jgi:hypothetical protein
MLRDRLDIANVSSGHDTGPRTFVSSVVCRVANNVETRKLNHSKDKRQEHHADERKLDSYRTMS